MRNLQLLVILVLIIFTVSLIQKEGLGNKEAQKKILRFQSQLLLRFPFLL